jgi:2,3-bisphosphoglycerate-independent phosphoglycerate mutase
VVPSEKVRSYDVVPQMSARKITDELIERSKKDFNFIVANYANPDMVGHSGKMEAAVKAVEFVDKCLNILVPKLLENGYEVILTADHGNCDEMIDLKSGKPNKEHSLNPVPFIYLTAGNKGSFQGFDDFVSSEPIGVLADIAPSICSTLGLKQGDQMIGLNLKKSLI